jgi:hypothetical protein
MGQADYYEAYISFRHMKSSEISFRFVFKVDIEFHVKHAIYSKLIIW